MCLKPREYTILLWTCINKHWNIREELSRTVSCTLTLSITTEYAIRITDHNYNESQKPSTLMKGEITSEIIYCKGFVHPHTLKLIIQDTTLQSEILRKRFHMWYTTTRISRLRNSSLLQGFSALVWCQLHTNLWIPSLSQCRRRHTAQTCLAEKTKSTRLANWESQKSTLTLQKSTHTPDLSRPAFMITTRTVCHIFGTHAHGDS